LIDAGFVVEYLTAPVAQGFDSQWQMGQILLEIDIRI
jgi:hypothetical protein